MSALKNPLPTRKRSYKFALTPLADAMFQLLIFFMLTSSLTPYSLVTLQSASPASDGELTQSAPVVIDETAPIGEVPTGPQGPVWIIHNARIALDEQSFEIDQVNDLAGALSAQLNGDILTLMLTDQARVQDIASVLAALKHAQVNNIDIQREAQP